MNMDTIISGVVLSKICSIRADKDSEETKNINLVICFNGATLGDVFTKAVSSAVISWQNGIGRKNFDTYTNGQTVKIDFKAPGKAPAVNPEEYMRAKLAAMTPEERIAYIEENYGSL